MMEKLREKVKESLSSVLPITVIVLLLSILLIPMEVGAFSLFLAGAVFLIFGMGFFQLGADISMTQLGQGIGGQLIKKRNLLFIVGGCFLMGVLITISEPDLQVLANQVASIPNRVLVLTVAVGVGIFLVVAVLRILFKISLSRLLTLMYLLLFWVALAAPGEFLAVAFDSGGVTTGPMTVPFIMALGIGLSAARSDRTDSDGSAPWDFLSPDRRRLYSGHHSGCNNYTGCDRSVSMGTATVHGRGDHQHASDPCRICTVSGCNKKISQKTAF